MSSDRHRKTASKTRSGTTKKSGRKSRSGSSNLGREQIIAAALELIDQRGLESFSLREVARHLGVFPTALYWHVPGGRNTLLAEVTAIAFQDVAPSVEPSEDWTGWLSELFHRYRSALRRHPNVAPLLGAQLVSNAGVNPEIVESILTALETAGFADGRLVDAYNAVVAAMLGYVTLELAPMPADDPLDWATAFEDKIRSLPPSQYPRLTANLKLLANRAFIVRWRSGIEAPLTTGFELYVEAFIAGLQRLADDTTAESKS